MYVSGHYPLGALYALNGGIPVDHRAFWKDTTVQHLINIYSALHATPSRVLKVLKEPIVMNSAKAHVFGYLLQFIKTEGGLLDL